MALSILFVMNESIRHSEYQELSIVSDREKLVKAVLTWRPLWYSHDSGAPSGRGAKPIWLWLIRTVCDVK